jgi:hypothetical protein
MKHLNSRWRRELGLCGSKRFGRPIRYPAPAAVAIAVHKSVRS